MLQLARQTLGPVMDRVQLRHGYVDTAAAGPFDATTCILTLHFVTRDDRRRTLVEIHRRFARGRLYQCADLLLGLYFSRLGGAATLIYKT